MTPSPSRMTRRTIRAPQQPNKALIDPPFFSLGEVIAENRIRHANADVAVGGISLVELSTRARSALYEQALQYTSQYRNVSEYSQQMPTSLILSGHQPKLFHPGVWFKNVALSQWARRQTAAGIQTTGVQLIIDSDLCRETSIRVPTGTLAAPTVTNVSFDLPSAAIPFEERSILDAEQFGDFDKRTIATIEPLILAPLIGRLWSSARQAQKSTSNLGQVLAQARHCFEQSWGLETLELPWSLVCDSEPFRHFAVTILQRIVEFREIYNDVLREYRRINKVRGRSRPVAELSEADGWIETPFWCWTSDAPQRRPLYVRFTGDNDSGATNGSSNSDLTNGDLELRSANEQVSTIRLCKDIHKAVEQLADARAQGFKVRSRALVTTMYARLCLSDAFIHGIGGAKYDELTDEIVHRFWNYEPPQYFVLSATVPLPITRATTDKDDLRRIDGLLRDLWYHPENHMEPDGDHSAQLSVSAQVDPIHDSSLTSNPKLLTQQKRDWINSSSADPKQRHDGIVSTTVELRKHVSTLREALLDERRALLQQLRHSAILSSREYSFSLFPENRLRRTLLDLLP